MEDWLKFWIMKYGYKYQYNIGIVQCFRNEKYLIAVHPLNGLKAMLSQEHFGEHEVQTMKEILVEQLSIYSHEEDNS